MPMLMPLCFSCMTVEVRHLRSFLAIAEEGSVTRAAERLHVSQPALSRTLTQLERALGVQLVDRSTHHLHLTEAGRTFQAAAAKSLRGFDAALASVAVGAAPLRLGHNWSSGAYTAAIARAWNAAHPDRPLVVRRVEERMAGLDRGEVDVALTRGPVRDRALRTMQIDEEPRVAVLPAAHRLTRRKTLTLADLAGEQLVVNTMAGVTTPELWPAGSRPGVVADTTTLDDWLIAIATGVGFGVSVASTAALQPHPDVRYVPLVDAPDVPLLLVWLTRAPHPHVRDFVRVAHAALQQQRLPAR
jgi:DNA-binding transcriptional LysR family regulator